MTDMKHVIVQCANEDTSTIRKCDLHPVHSQRDPAQNHAHAHVSINETQNSPKKITLGTMAPFNLTHAKIYPDEKLWNLVHDAAL